MCRGSVGGMKRKFSLDDFLEAVFCASVVILFVSLAICGIVLSLSLLHYALFVGFDFC